MGLLVPHPRVGDWTMVATNLKSCWKSSLDKAMTDNKPKVHLRHVVLSENGTEHYVLHINNKPVHWHVTHIPVYSPCCTYPHYESLISFEFMAHF